MNIRAYQPTDLTELERIHAKHYGENRLVNLFDKHVLCAVTVEDDEGVITIGAVKTLVECLMYTDKDRSPTDRIQAIHKLSDALGFVTRKHGYDQVYAFLYDPHWSKRLQKKFGFRADRGQALVLDLLG